MASVMGHAPKPFRESMPAGLVQERVTRHSIKHIPILENLAKPELREDYFAIIRAPLGAT